MCTINNSAHTKKNSENLFNDPCTTLPGLLAGADKALQNLSLSMPGLN